MWQLHPSSAENLKPKSLPVLDLYPTVSPLTTLGLDIPATSTTQHSKPHAGHTGVSTNHPLISFPQPLEIPFTINYVSHPSQIALGASNPRPPTMPQGCPLRGPFCYKRTPALQRLPY